MPSRRRLLAALAAIAVAASALVAVALSEPGEDEPDVPRRPPVVLLILDEFPTDALLAPDGGIDAERFPNFARLAERSTWFPNAHTIYDSTFKAVPAILDARLPRPKAGSDFHTHRRSVFSLFDDLGYGIVKVESASALCPPRVCPTARTKRPGVLARLAGGGRPARMNRWIAAIRPRPRPTFYLQHALLPHEPWIYLPSGRQSRPAGLDPVPDLTHDIGFHDPDLTLHNRQRQLLQIGYVDHLLGRLLAQMRRTDLLDQALLVVTADHGYAWEVGVKTRRETTRSNVDEVAPVPLFVKTPNQSEGGVDESYVRNIDVVPTIADVLDVRLTWPNDGHSAFSAVTHARDGVRVIDRDFKQAAVTISAEEMERRRAELRAGQAEIFGTGAGSRQAFGDPWAAVYRVGPRRDLLGRGVDAMAVSVGGATRAETANARLFEHVRRSSAVIPTRLTGALVGDRPRARGVRDLAAAVDGVVVATGRSFRLRGRRLEYFSLMLPEDSLRPGRNRVELFEVAPGSDQLRRLPTVPAGDSVGPPTASADWRRYAAQHARRVKRERRRAERAQGTR